MKESEHEYTYEFIKSGVEERACTYNIESVYKI